jgi:hypothetical protein
MWRRVVVVLGMERLEGELEVRICLWLGCALSSVTDELNFDI